MSPNGFKIELIDEEGNFSGISINGNVYELKKDRPERDKDKVAPSEFWDQNLIYMVIRDEIKKLDESRKMIKSIEFLEFSDFAFFFESTAKTGTFFRPGATTEDLFKVLKEMSISLYEQMYPKIKKFGTTLYFTSLMQLESDEHFPGISLYAGVRESNSWSHYTEPELI